MLKTILTAVASMIFAAVASAHFPFAVPQKDGLLKVVFSDNLETDEGVTVEKLAKLELTVRGADGKDSKLSLKAGEHELTGTPIGQPRAAFGTVDYGIIKRDQEFLLRYHVKALWPGFDEKSATIGSTAALEIVPRYEGDQTVLLVLSWGEPLADAEVNLIVGEKKSKLKTDAKGRTEPQMLALPFGAWSKRSEMKDGEFEKSKYREIRHYATLVVAAK